METVNEYNNLTVDLVDGNGSSTSNVKTATFEQAFLGEEDFSDAKGGRAKRKARKLSRIADRQEVKQARKGGRQQARIARRSDRKTARQDIRNQQQASRQQRRANVRSERQTSREAKARRKMTDTESDQERENYAMEQEDLRNQNYPETQYEEPQYEEPQYENESVEYEDANYPTYEGDEAPADENSDEYEDEDNYSSEDELFGDDYSGFANEVTGKAETPTNIDAICLKIEFNNEMISRFLEAKKRQASESKVNPAIDTELSKRYDRVKELENQLQKFAGMSGENATMVKNSKLKARQQRFESIVPPVVVAKLKAKGVAPARIKEWWKTVGSKKYASNFSNMSGDATTEDVNPAEWGMPAFNVNLTDGEQQANFSGVDGSKSTISTKSILIGAVVGFSLIYIIRKYKLLK